MAQPQRPVDADAALPGLASRILIAATGLVLSLVVTCLGIAAVTRFINPELANRFWPRDAVATANRADLMLQRSDAAAESLATESLARKAINPQALRVLGFVRDSRGDHAGAATLIAEAGRQSRRDVATQLWLIQEAVAHNDAAAALDHYDIALRTSAVSANILFPVLIGVLDDPEFIAPVTRVLRRYPPWLDAFLDRALTSGKVALPLARIVPQLDRIPAQRRHYIDTELIDQMITAKAFGAARGYAARLGTVVATGPFRTIRFVGTGPVTAFDWRLDGAAPRVEGGDGLAIFGDAPVTVAARLVMLAPGPYRLAAPGLGPPSSARRPNVTLDCAETGGVLASVEPRPAHASGNFVVPPTGCTAQWLRVVAPGSAVDPGEVGQVDAIEVARR